MSHPTATIQPPLDLEAMWQNSLIRVSDQLTIPPVVLRVDEAIIGTLGNFSVSTGKAKSKKTFNVCALVAAALINIGRHFQKANVIFSISIQNKVLITANW